MWIVMTLLLTWKLISLAGYFCSFL
uniref:Uncharacterized protein n=1 Tax=Arundo donax TaxID=35708 RepID=A0A0A9NIE0_ARUDO